MRREMSYEELVNEELGSAHRIKDAVWHRIEASVRQGKPAPKSDLDAYEKYIKKIESLTSVAIQLLREEA